jgi:16S rRNA (guanine(966)-N(2))-methyltransferase RsmD
MSLRIIGGVWRSRRLVRPDTEATRPVPDRVKQTVFDILGSRFGTPGALPPLRVADVFAGSGSMGLEALSRGAQSCCFYERDREVLAVLRRNVETLRAGAVSTIIVRDAWRAAARDPNGRAFDLIFLDPPYRDSEDVSPIGEVSRFLHRLAEDADNRPLVILHHFSKVRFSLDADNPWSIGDERTIGSSAVTFFLR